MNQLSQAIDASVAGDPAASARLFPLMYEELRMLAARKLAAERPGHTLEPTALVHEAYLRVVGAEPPGGWNGRAHFFAAAAEAMRRILIDSARRRAAQRHGGGGVRADFEDALDAIAAPSVDHSIAGAEDLLALDAVLSKLEAEDKPRADLVKLHYFVGLSLEDAAEALGISRATAYRQWTYTRAWLRHEIAAQKS